MCMLVCVFVCARMCVGMCLHMCVCVCKAEAIVTVAWMRTKIVDCRLSFLSAGCECEHEGK